MGGGIKINKKEFKNRAYSYKTFKLNKSKYELLETYAVEAKNFRNMVSEIIYNDYRQKIFYREIDKNKLVTELKHLNKCTTISAADCQQAIRDVYTKYEINLDVFIKKHYKINMYSHPYRFLFNYMIRYFKDQKSFEDFLEKKYLEEKKELTKILKQNKELTCNEFRSLHFYMYLRKIYNDVKAKNFFKGQTNLNFISFVRYTQDFIIKKINKVTYKSLTFNHMNVIGKTMNVSGMLEKSHIKLTNTVIHINLPKIATIDLPVRYSKKYHGTFKDYKYNLNKRTGQKQYLIQISFDEVKKEVKITLVRDINKNISDNYEGKQIFGVDVNVKHNIFALSNYETQKIDKDLVKKIVKEKKKLKKIQSQRDKLKLPKEYSKRQKRIQNKINKQVVYLQNYACYQLLSTHENSILVMENLERGLKKCKINNKQYEEELNYNDLFSLLRIYSMKDAVIRMSGNYNVNVVLVNPDFTSQMCPKCGHISKNNRKSQETFCCEKCNHKNNADINAAKNIKGRFTNSKFREELQKEVTDTQLISEPKILNRFKFKQKLFEITNN